MLLESVVHVSEEGGDTKLLWGRLYGQERNLTTSGIARINLYLHGIEDFRIVRGDTLRDPKLFEGDQLSRFDCVIANPPFSLKHWGEDLWATDPFGRNFAGVPPGKSGDYAWVQHMICSMADVTGRMAVVLPRGALFRMGSEGKIRRRILESDLVEAIIGLGPNLFYGTGLAACILVLRRQKDAQHENKILFIDASREFKRGRNQNTLEPDQVERITSWYWDYTDVEGVARIVDLDEIAENEFNMNISRYVELPLDEEILSVEEAMANLRNALEEAYAAEDRFKGLLREAGLMV
jgi:type I restriction enzyme M protein